MRNIDDVSKGLAGFVSLNEPFGRVSKKERAFELLLEGCEICPTFAASYSRLFTEWILAVIHVWPALEDQFHYNGTMREEYAEDAPFVERRRDHPPPSFQVGLDVYTGYFLAVR
jgi:hypothetical protein